MSEHFQPPPFHPDRPSLVAPVRLDPTGRNGPTRVQVRGKGWRQASHGLHLPADVDSTVVEQRIVEVAARIPPGRGVITGWAALRWLGARWFDGGTASDPCGLPVMVATIHKLHQAPGMKTCREGYGPSDVIVVDGLPITVPVRSVAFEMRYAATVRDAVRAFDMAAYDDLVSRDELIAYAGLAPRTGLSSWTGMPQCRKATLLGDENAWSPQEVAMRMVWELNAGLSRPLTNVPIFDLRGNHIGTPDLLDPVAGLLGEYDGPLHLEGSRRAGDIRREEAFRDVGLECVTAMAGDTGDRSRLAARIIAARGRALWLPEEQRQWTIQPPAWWIPTRTVAQRRALTEAQRERLLRYRVA
ncbi:MAG: hypothetical protein ACRDOM_00130 [Nocardioides sp.]